MPTLVNKNKINKNSPLGFRNKFKFHLKIKSLKSSHFNHETDVISNIKSQNLIILFKNKQSVKINFIKINLII